MGNQATASELMGNALERLKTKMPSSSECGECGSLNSPDLHMTGCSQMSVFPKPLFDVDGSMERAGFPKRFIGRQWETPEFVKKYAPPDKRDSSGGIRDFKGLFLTGATGRKKTASLCLMARDWMKRARKTTAWRFVSFPEVCVELQESWKDGGHGPMEIIERLARVPLLILDDVGAEKTSDFVLQSAYLLFNKREQNEMPTYGTSNLSVEEIGKKLDERIASRIRGMCHVVQVGGEDQRGRA